MRCVPRSFAPLLPLDELPRSLTRVAAMHIPFLTDDPSDASFPYFWGPIDSLHTFCERKYITHPMAAEFYNCLGSLIYCVAAC